jgi:hypothetical protein
LDYSNILKKFIDNFSPLPECQCYDVYNNLLYDPDDPMKYSINRQYSVYGHDMSIAFGDSYAYTKVYPLIGDVVDILWTRKDLTPFEILVGPKLGYVILGMATGDLCQYGDYSPEPDGFLSDIPYWNSPGERVYEPNKPFPVRFKSLGEPGFKARPLTIGKWSVVTVLQALRQAVEPTFYSDPSLRLGFGSQNVLWDILKYVQKNRTIRDNSYFMNSDFKSATDYIPLSVIKSLWTGYFRGQGITPGHPAHIFLSVLWEPRVIHPSSDCQWMNGEILQTRGSFQGEPMSFLTLTLLNVCGVEIAAQMSFGCLKGHLSCSLTGIRLKSERTYEDNLAIFSVERKFPLLYGIVGDDNMSIADKKFRRIFTNIMLLVGMQFSPGKDLGSRNLLILCEDHAFYDEEDKTLKFLDVVKHRLLSRMTRVHSDHRSAIIGKASMLTTQLSWETNRLLAACARLAYMWSFRDEMEVKTFLADLPHEFPNNLGGINLPRSSWTEIKRKFSLELRLLSWVVKLPLPKFLYYYLQLSQITERVQKGSIQILSPQKYLRVFNGYIEGDFDEYHRETSSRFYGRNTVIELLATNDPPVQVPRSPYSGQPINSELIRLVKEHLHLVPLSKFLDQEKRRMVFRDLLTDPGRPIDTVSYASYQRKSHKLWKSLRKLMQKGLFNEENPLPEIGFSSVSQMGSSFAWRMSVFIDKRLLDGENQSEEPSMTLSFGKGEGTTLKCRNCGRIHSLGLGGLLDELMSSPCAVGLTGDWQHQSTEETHVSGDLISW